MTDFLTKEARSRLMASIPSRDTEPELRLRKGLFAAGVRGWRCHPKGVTGRPDIAFLGLKLAVFVDGGFWHGHPAHFTPGKSGKFWDEKIENNQQRDQMTNADLRAAGWQVLRLWDFEVNEDLDTCVKTVSEVVAKLRAGAA